MATLSSLRTATRRLIDDTDSSNPNVGNGELNDYLNQALRQTATRLEWAIQTATASTVANQQTYSLPDNFIGILEAFYNNSRLTVIDRTDLSAQFESWKSDGAGTPTRIFKADNALIGLHPKPDTSSVTIEIHYVKLPATLSADTDSPDIIEAVQDSLTFYAAYLVHLRFANAVQAKDLYKYYEDHVIKLKARVSAFAQDMLRFNWYGQSAGGD